MSCKGCQDRKAKLAAWIRRKIGVTEVLTTQGKYFTKYVDTNVENLQKRIADLVRAGSELESALSALDEANSALHVMSADEREVLRERVMAMRTMMKQNRDDVRKAQISISDISHDIVQMFDRIEKLEFPGFKPVTKD